MKTYIVLEYPIYQDNISATDADLKALMMKAGAEFVGLGGYSHSRDVEFTVQRPMTEEELSVLATKLRTVNPDLSVTQSVWKDGDGLDGVFVEELSFDV